MQKKGKTTTAGSGRTKFHGIVEQAGQLRVSRGHLWQVLTGRRQSKVLLQRYLKLTRNRKFQP